MCTVSWLRTPDAFHVFFNRDEQISRPTALPPEPMHVEGCAILAPKDPLRGGTWLAVSDTGAVTALMNYYTATPPMEQTGKTSRGLLVHRLMALPTPQAVHERLTRSEAAAYAPFHLLRIDPDTVHQWTWDGRILHDEERTDQDPPLTTSSLAPNDVGRYRLQRYRALCHLDGPTVESLRRFHEDREVGHEAEAPNVLRKDVRTVSISHIQVFANEVIFEYDDVHQPRSTMRMDRR